MHIAGKLESSLTMVPADFFCKDIDGVNFLFFFK